MGLIIAGGVDQFVGVMLGGRIGFADVLALALRGEYIGDPDSFDLDGDGNPDMVDLVTGTLTFEWAPDEHFVIRLDNRIDYSNVPFAVVGPNDSRDVNFSTILGVVAHSD